MNTLANKSTYKTPLPLFFVLTFVITWCLWTIPILATHGVIPALPGGAMFPVLAVGAFGPFFAAFITLYRDGGWPAMRQFALRCLRWRIKLIYLLPTLFLSPLLAGIAVYITAEHGGPPFSLAMHNPLEMLETFLLLFFLGGSVDEEFGWAYAIDRLLQRLKPLPAAFTLGVIWGCWHLPLFFIIGTTQTFMPFWAFLILTVGLRLQYVWAYEGTGKSILVTLLYHTSVNMAFSLFVVVVTKPGVLQFGFIVFALLTLAISVVMALTSKLYRSSLRPVKA